MTGHWRMVARASGDFWGKANGAFESEEVFVPVWLTDQRASSIYRALGQLEGAGVARHRMTMLIPDRLIPDEHRHAYADACMFGLPVEINEQVSEVKVAVDVDY